MNFSTVTHYFTKPRLSAKEQMFLVKRLSFLIHADVGLLESLEMIRAQTRKVSQQKILDSLIKQVSAGISLSASMATFGDMFGEFAMNIIRVGEMSGILAENLEYLADELKKKQNLKRKMIGAFIYPAVVTIATLGITAFLMIYLFPKIMPVFASLHTKLPVSTRMVIAASFDFQHYGLWIVLAILIFIFSYFILRKKVLKFRLLTDQFLLKIPIIGTAVQYYNLANFTRTVGLLLKSGLTLSESLPVATQVTENLAYRREFRQLARIVNRGGSLSEQLRNKRRLFPDIVVQITSVGERSGNLSHSFIYLSQLYEGEMEEFTKNLGTIVEPVLMIVMGVIVGFIAVSIITPIYGITQSLHA